MRISRVHLISPDVVPSAIRGETLKRSVTVGCGVVLGQWPPESCLYKLLQIQVPGNPSAIAIAKRLDRYTNFTVTPDSGNDDIIETLHHYGDSLWAFSGSLQPSGFVEDRILTVDPKDFKEWMGTDSSQSEGEGSSASGVDDAGSEEARKKRKAVAR